MSAKVKTHRGAKKRFKISATGKVMYKKSGMRHINEHMSRKRQRGLNQTGVLNKTDSANIRRLLPYA